MGLRDRLRGARKRASRKKTELKARQNERRRRREKRRRERAEVKEEAEELLGEVKEAAEATRTGAGFKSLAGTIGSAANVAGDIIEGEAQEKTQQSRTPPTTTTTTTTMSSDINNGRGQALEVIERKTVDGQTYTLKKFKSDRAETQFEYVVFQDGVQVGDPAFSRSRGRQEFRGTVDAVKTAAESEMAGMGSTGEDPAIFDPFGGGGGGMFEPGDDDDEIDTFGGAVDFIDSDDSDGRLF